MQASIIVTRYKEPNSILHDTLESLSLQQSCKVEVLMLDQFHNTDTQNYCSNLNKVNPNIIFYYEVITPKSLSYARNYGIQKASCDYILCIDSDAIASKNRAYEIITCFNSNKDIGIAGTRILPKRNGKRNIFSYSKFFQADYSMLDYGIQNQQVDKVIGASFCLSKSRLGKLAHFDENLGRKNGVLLGGEETELCKQVVQQGLQVRYIGKAHVLHQVSAERLNYKRILKRVFWGGVSRYIKGGTPQPHSTRKNRTDYITLPIYALFYLSGIIYARIYYPKLKKH